MKFKKYTPTNISTFSKSQLSASLDLHAKNSSSEINYPESDEMSRYLQEMGKKYEAKFGEILQAKKLDVCHLNGEISDKSYENTLLTLNKAYDFVSQTFLNSEKLYGVADYLMKVSSKSDLGNFSYEPVEIKLATFEKPSYILQSIAYCELLNDVLGKIPENFHLHLGGGKFKTFKTKDYYDWYKNIVDKYEKFLSKFSIDDPLEYLPGDHGKWNKFVQKKLKEKGDIIQVHAMRMDQRKKFMEAGIKTIFDLKNIDLNNHKVDLNNGLIKRFKSQATLQVRTTSEDNPAYEIRPINEQEKGLKLLPIKNEGDMFFDFEGYPDPLTAEKLEYLIGITFKDKEGKYIYKSFWAHNSDEEKKAFSDFVKFINERKINYPSGKLFHYGNYEKNALGNLAAKHQIHIETIDDWLRSEYLIDLFPITKNAIILGSESYSIKYVERIYLKDLRQEEISTAGDSVIQYANWINLKDEKILDSIEAYNKQDCDSTQQLRDFLLNLPEYKELKFATQKVKSDINDNLTVDEININVLDEEAKKFRDNYKLTELKNKEYLIKLISELIPFHPSEERVEFWEFFARLNDKTPEELTSDGEVIVNCKLQKIIEIKKSLGLVYSFNENQVIKIQSDLDFKNDFCIAPIQTTANNLLIKEAIKTDDDKYFLKLKGSLDEENKNFTLKISRANLEKYKINQYEEINIYKFPSVISKYMESDCSLQAQSWNNGSSKISKAFLNFLDRQPIKGISELNEKLNNEENNSDEISNFLFDLKDQTLAIQGPPGTGKTTFTAELISKLIEKGLRVAISSNGHKAINNILLKVENFCKSNSIKGNLYKRSSSSSIRDDEVYFINSSISSSTTYRQDVDVLGATVFSLSKQDYFGQPFDYLIVDESGQVSSANLLYMSQCAKNILLVGDQQQLSQPKKAAHPGDSGLSSLEYFMNGEDIIPADKGFFLPKSWRMPPTLTKVVSQMFYEGKLEPELTNNSNKVFWSGKNSGLVFFPVKHKTQNSSFSIEEAEYIYNLLNQIIGSEYQFISNSSSSKNEDVVLEKKLISPEDILVTTPYNAQKNLLQNELKGLADVGTVDKFQGLEKPIAIYSLASTDSENAPRGLSFVLNANRLNVAISRAKCLSIVVGSPELANCMPKNVEEAKQLSRFCKILSFMDNH